MKGLRTDQQLANSMLGQKAYSQMDTTSVGLSFSNSSLMCGTISLIFKAYISKQAMLSLIRNKCLNQIEQLTYG